MKPFVAYAICLLAVAVALVVRWPIGPALVAVAAALTCRRMES